MSSLKKESELISCGLPQLTPAESDSHSESSSSSGEGTPDRQSRKDVDDAVDDVYGDVRDVMEALAKEDRLKFGKGEEEEEIPFFASWTTYLGYAVLIMVGHIRDICAGLFGTGRYVKERPLRVAPLLKSWENFYTRRLYHRIQDCFNRPIASQPGANIQVLERISHDGNKTMQVLGKLDNLPSKAEQETYQAGPFYQELDDGRVTRSCLNLGSYNYLGFADDWHDTCRTQVLDTLENMPISSGSSRMELGSTTIHQELEKTVAAYVGKPASLCLNMGYNTNATTIPALVGRGDLIISDDLNHTSIVSGARASGAAIRIFRHNNATDLERVLRQAIVMGQPRTRRPWNKVMVIVEGIYSMEGEYCDLPSVVKVSKKYGAFVYLDEAHSIGALGPTGRGCCEYTGVDPADIDILMGTFTKSFGGMGGYIASSENVISHLRTICAASSFHNSLSPTVCRQIISALTVISTTQVGKDKIQRLRDNSNYFRMKLKEMGLNVLGHYDSPIMPVMLYNPTKIGAFSRECLKRGLAVVVVGFPAVPILTSRARFCISAGHTRQDLDRALVELEEVTTILKLRYKKSALG